MPRKERPRIHYFDLKVDRNGPISDHRPDLGPCWIWTGCVNPVTRYATFWDGEKVLTGHRWSYSHYVGPIPEGLSIDHLCRVRECVNPAHLEAVTLAENNQRASVAVVASRTHCGNGHEWTEENTLRRPDRPNARGCRACTNASQRRRRAERNAQTTDET